MIPQALAVAPALLARTEEVGQAFIVASVVRGPAVLLGAGQRAGRVLDLEACAAAATPVYRRLTSGTAAYVGEQGIVWTLALPHVSALVPDATPRTLLNRNVRGFLRGLSRAGGAPAHYFGREWISVRKRPAALLGFEMSPSGAVVIEVIAGIDASIGVPEALATADERAQDRWLGKVPAGLGELMPGDALAIARAVMETVGMGAAIQTGVAPCSAGEPQVTRADSPMPPGYVPGPAARVPIGWLDTGIDPASGEVWLGGDALVPAHVYRAVARGEPVPEDAAVEGASMADLHAAVRGARAVL